jgi:hypothetical protein
VLGESADGVLLGRTHFGMLHPADETFAPRQVGERVAAIGD